VAKNNVQQLLLQTHQMTALLESVDWDEEKQKSLIAFFEKSINKTSNEKFLKDVEEKYGLSAKNVIKSIITSESYYMRLHDAGGKNGN
jgi:hypothetical protein